MIIEFSVANFLSFKDKVTFSMLANSSDGLNDNYIEVNNRKILKTSAIYGANASGKTNLFKILTIVISMLRNSNYINVNSKLPIVPFNFDKDMAKKSSEFEIRFIASGVRYVYGFIADTTNVYEEYLYYYPNGRETKIFDRTNINEYSFPQGDERRLNDIATKNTPNKFFIATATNWNYKKTEIPYRFLTEDIRTFNNLAALRDVSLREYLKDSKELKDFALEFLKKADFNIKDYKVLETDVPEDVLAAIPDFIKIGMNIPQKPKTFNAVFKHTGNDLELSY